MRFVLVFALAVSMDPQEPRFQVGSRLVTLPAMVTNAQGQVVDGLSAADFVVLDNGRPQTVTVDTIGTGVAPIALLVAVQSSGVSAAVIEKVQKAAGMFQPLILGERGCAGLIAFAERVQWLQECTSDSDAIERAFLKLRPGEYRSARLLDAAGSAIASLAKQQNARRILLLISESRDRGSESDLALVTTAAQSAGVTVYAATYSALKTGFTMKGPVRQQEPKAAPPLIPNPNRTWNGAPPSRYNPLIAPPEDRLDVLAGAIELARLRKVDSTRILTRGTGGRTLPFARQKGLEQAIEVLASELHEQYVLSFIPPPSDPGYHVLQVRIAGRGALRVRTRPGYWSAQEVQ